MKSMRPLLEIEWKNRNFFLHIVLSSIVFFALVTVLRMVNEPFVTRVLSFSILAFVLFGLIWSITMVEDLKNDLDSNLIKTFISYPVTPVHFIASKQSLFLMADLVSSTIGSLAAFIIIGNLKFQSLELFLLATFFTILSSRALFLAVALVSKLGFLAEIILVFYYFVILFLTFSMTSQGAWLFTLFPYLHFFEGILSMPPPTMSNLNFTIFPLIYFGLIFLAFLILRILKWFPLFDFE